MKKILILANNDVGLYNFRKELILELQKQGFKIVIALPYGEKVDLLTVMGCEFINTPLNRRGMNPLTDLTLVHKYIKIIKQIKPDLVITYTIKPNIYGGIACRIQKTKYAVNITGLGTTFQKENGIKMLVVFLYKIALKKAKVCFFENKGNKEVFIKEGIVPARKTRVLNGAGVNLEEFPYTPYPEELGEIHFLFIGRIMKEKGVDELFNAAKRIRKEYPNTCFDIVGPLEDNYKAMVDRLVQEDIIHYHGDQSDVRPYIKKCHCLVLPSYHEGMSNVLLEGAAMGRPLITSDIHGCREAVENNQSGILITPQNVHSLYGALKEFIKLEHSEKTEMSKNSLMHIFRKFDKKIIVCETINALMEVI